MIPNVLQVLKGNLTELTWRKVRQFLVKYIKMCKEADKTSYPEFFRTLSHHQFEKNLDSVNFKSQENFPVERIRTFTLNVLSILRHKSDFKELLTFITETCEPGKSGNPKYPQLK